MFQGLSHKFHGSPNYSSMVYNVVFPGSEMPGWFSHQCMGNKVKIMEPFSHFCNDLIGIAICVVFGSLPHHQIQSDYPIVRMLQVGRQYFYTIPGKMVTLSDHTWLFYYQIWHKKFWKCGANGFIKIGIKIKNEPSYLVKKCGLRMVYKKDIEDLNCNVVQHSNNSIIPYEGLKESLNLWPMVNTVRSHYHFLNSSFIGCYIIFFSSVYIFKWIAHHMFD